MSKNPDQLKELLDAVEDGRIQLPEFQREWVWDDEHVKSLLASICQSFPIGAIMMLEAGGDIRFKSRLVESVPSNSISSPSDFLLDGQQRLTSLYQALRHSGPVNTRSRRGKSIKRWYYINMLKALEDNLDWEDIIQSMPENKRAPRNFRRENPLDLSSPELEYEEHMVPTNCLLEGEDWRFEYQNYWDQRGGHPHEEGAKGCCSKFKSHVRDKLMSYHLPVLRLNKETPKEAVCTVFEKVNTGGVPLNTFDLVTAAFAADDFELRRDWAERRKRLYNKFMNLQGIEGEQFLQTVTLLTSQGHQQDAINSREPSGQVPAISCKKRDILDLNLSDYKKWADKAERGFEHAAQFLHRQFIFRKEDVPYNTQLVPLAAIYASLEKKLHRADAIERLARWFWSGIFGEAYGGAIETQFALDLAQVGEFIRSGSEPRLVTEANLAAERLISLRKRNSAAYKGLYALQMKCGARDWQTGEPLSFAIWNDVSIDIHHIFPVDWCTSEKRTPKVPQVLYDSIINKTPIDARTNRDIGGSAPSDYLKELSDKIDVQILDRVLLAHWIEPDLLRQDKFSESFIERGQAMLDLIYKTIGKPEINRDEIREVFEKAITSAGYPLDA